MGKACVGMVLSVAPGCSNIPILERKVSACGNKWASQVRSVAVTTAFILVLPVSLGREGVQS